MATETVDNIEGKPEREKLYLDVCVAVTTGSTTLERLSRDVCTVSSATGLP
jgi:hypothetical protein